MSERWIKLRLHRRHRKIVRLSHLLGINAEAALALAVDWFRALDADTKLARVTLNASEVQSLCGCDKDVADAFADADVRWLKRESTTTFRVRDLRKWISERHLGRERVTLHRRNKNAVDKTRVEGDERENSERTGHGNHRDSIQSTGKAGTGEPRAVARRLEVLRAARVLGIAKNNERAFCNYVEAIPRGFKCLARILRQADAQQLTGEAKAKYVYKAIKMEAHSAGPHRETVAEDDQHRRLVDSGGQDTDHGKGH
jgi:hypothetical protein